MRHASFSTSIDLSTPDISLNAPTRKSLFAILIEALHHSRRLQARRIIRQYRRLIASSRASSSNDGGRQDVSR